jgi:hypothetical protein
VDGANLRNHRVKAMKAESKDLKAEVWSVRDYPITIDTLKPLFHLLGFASKNISKLNDFLFNQTSIPKD